MKVNKKKPVELREEKGMSWPQSKDFSQKVHTEAQKYTNKKK